MRRLDIEMFLLDLDDLPDHENRTGNEKWKRQAHAVTTKTFFLVLLS